MVETHQTKFKTNSNNVDKAKIGVGGENRLYEMEEVRMERSAVATRDRGGRRSTRLRSGGNWLGGRRQFFVSYNSLFLIFSIKHKKEGRKERRQRGGGWWLKW